MDTSHVHTMLHVHHITHTTHPLTVPYVRYRGGGTVKPDFLGPQPSVHSWDLIRVRPQE